MKKSDCKPRYLSKVPFVVEKSLKIDPILFSTLKSKERRGCLIAFFVFGKLL